MDGLGPDKVTSHALHSDLEDLTPAGSGNSTPLSDYSPHSQPFAERPENRTMAGMAARQTLSALPSPPPFTPAAGQSSGTPQVSAAGSNNDIRQAWSPAAPGDTPGVTSAWQPGYGSPGSSSVTFAFTPVATGEAASPDAQPFGHAEQVRWPISLCDCSRAAAAASAAGKSLQSKHAHQHNRSYARNAQQSKHGTSTPVKHVQQSDGIMKDADWYVPPVLQGQTAQQQASTAAHKAADLVRAAERKLSASHDSDAMSDASGSIASTNASARSSSMPAGSPGDILRAATSKLSAQHAISKCLLAVLLARLTWLNA